MKDKELIKWVSIVRAQRRLPFLLKEVADRYHDRPMTDFLIQTIRKYLDDRLEEERNPEMGEMERIYAIVRPSGNRYEVELITDSERKGLTKFPS